MQRPIEVATSIGAGFAQVCEVLADDPGVVSGDGVTTHRYPPRRIVLGVDLGSGTSVHQEVLVRLGVAQTTETGLVVPVAWEATGRKRLFPTFAGELEASEADDGTRLRLHGTYTVPLGRGRPGRQRCRRLAPRLPVVGCTADWARTASRGRGGSARRLGARSGHAGVGTLRDLHRLNALAASALCRAGGRARRGEHVDRPACGSSALASASGLTDSKVRVPSLAARRAAWRSTRRCVAGRVLACHSFRSRVSL